MAVDIHNLIAAIVPDIFCDNMVDPVTYKPLVDEVKEIIEKERKKGNKHPYLKAAEKAKLKVGDWMDLEERGMHNPFDLMGIKNAVEQHELIYDAFGESLEPIYFWILDNVRGKVTKLIDNFASSASSSFFAEMGTRSTKMQEEAMKMLGTVNTVIKSVLNVLYDLKEFKIRLDTYKDSHSSDKSKANAAILSLKQIWLDQVDVKRGNTSIKGMAQQFDYVTLIDAFMASDSSAQLDKKKDESGFMDLNDRVRRLLQQRFSEYERWLVESEKELNKRFEIEKNYLKSQMATLKLYSGWIKPYLKAANDLEQSERKGDAALVTAFNTMVLELTLLAEVKYDPAYEIQEGDLPTLFKDLAERKKLKKYTSVQIVELKFRSAPERMSQGGYGFRGRVHVKFTSYALSDEELKILKTEIEEDDVGDTYRLIEQSTGESLDAIQKDIDEFLNDKKPEYKDDEKEKSDDTNPFSALLTFLKGEDKPEGMEKGPGKETDYDKVIRSRALVESRQICRKFYDIYKKAHSMPAFPGS